jgi:hypothetical protein
MGPDGVHIVDIKSGWEYGTDVSNEHREQLLLYAAIWQRVTGEWPHSASVQAADGLRASFEIDPTRAEAVVAEALAQFDSFNTAAVAAAAPESLASPSAESCHYCPFRGVCGPFFSKLTFEWQWWPKSLRGHVMKIVDDAVDSSAVDIRVAASNLAQEPLTHARVLGIPRGDVPSQGDEVTVIDACPTQHPNHVRVTWTTELVNLAKLDT